MCRPATQTLGKNGPNSLFTALFLTVHVPSLPALGSQNIYVYGESFWFKLQTCYHSSTVSVSIYMKNSASTFGSKTPSSPKSTRIQFNPSSASLLPPRSP